MPLQNKVTIDELTDSLLQESSKNFQESTNLQWEWDHYTKIYNIVNQIQEKESYRDATDLKADNNRLNAIEPFINWLKSHNVDATKIKIEDIGIDSGLGIVTTQPIKTGEEVLAIPDKIMITTANAKESKLRILSEKDPVVRTMPNVLLSLFLLYEKYVTKDASFWKPYIDILPLNYDTILYFTSDEMQLLKSSQHAFRDALRMYRNITRQYAYFRGVFRKATDSASRALKSVFTFKRYAWAASTAMTRQNSLSRPGEPFNELCLIPFWDMCNHEATGQYTNTYNSNEKNLVCTASRDYDAGEEFRIHYGERTSIEHLVHGGFVPKTYFTDYYNLDIGIGTHDRELTRKETILKSFGLKCQESFPVRPTVLASGKLKNLIIFIRIFQADTEFLDSLQLNVMDQLSLANPTEKVWEFLAARFGILKMSVENSKLNILKSICEEGDITKLSNKQQMIIQILTNEAKLLDILTHCSKNHLLTLQQEKELHNVDF